MENNFEVLVKGKENILVNDNASCGIAGEYASSLQELKKTIVKYFSPLKADALKSHKGIVAKEKSELLPINTEIGRVKGLINNFMLEEKRKADAIRLEEMRKQREREHQARMEAELLKNKRDAEIKELEADEIALEIIPEAKPEKVEMQYGTMATVKSFEVSISDPFKLLQTLIDGDIPLEAVNFTLNQRKIKKYLKETGIVSLNGLNISITDKVRIG